jgi:exonuclease SbcD
LTDFTFLHVADIHLDSPLLGLARYEGVPVDEVRLATRTALINLVDLAIEEAVSFVVIAGDIYDGDWPHFGTGLFFCAQMGRLEKAGIEVFLLYGNHDAQSVLTKKLPLPPNVHSFPSNKAKTFIHQATGAVLHGRSYRDRDTRDNLAIQYPPPTIDAFNIGVLHTALSGGRPPHASYAPCSLAELAAKGYQYWALGHVHEFEVVSDSPYVVFPGNLQGRSVRECGPKGAVIVTVKDDAVAKPPKHFSLDSVRWALIHVDVTGTTNETELHSRIRESLESAVEMEGEGRSLVARVTLTGTTRLHGWLTERRDQVQNDIRAIAVSISDGLWIEKIALKTIAVAQVSASGSTVLDELSGLLAAGSEHLELRLTLEADLAEFLARVPSELASENELLASVSQGDHQALLESATTALITRLDGGA